MLQPVAVERHHAGFGAGEEAGNQDESEESCKKKSQRGVVQWGLATSANESQMVEKKTVNDKSWFQSHKINSTTNFEPKKPTVRQPKATDTRVTAVPIRQPRSQ